MQRIRVFAVLTVLGCLGGVLPGAWPSAQGAAVTGQEVQAALDKAVAFLRARQAADGTWPDYPGRPGGITCLAALAMLTAGVPEGDPALGKALARVSALPHQFTYVVGLKAMALAAANPTKYRAELGACANWLVDAQIKTGPYEGQWRYTRRVTDGDNSNTQYAVLGLDACARAGISIDRPVWEGIERHFRNSQNGDGGWAYQPGRGASYGSMTAAGLASLYLAGVRLHTDFGPHVCGRYVEDKAITQAINWFARNFSVTTNPPNHGTQWLYYYLYGLERVGMVSAQKYLGAHNWYKEGVTSLVRTQGGNGSWGGGGGAQGVMSTSFAVLFLAKGRSPVLIQKVRWRGDWNNDLYDIANLVRFVGSQWEHPLSWQGVTAKDPLEELLEAPILYFNGHTAPNFDEEEKQRLRDYVDQGGFILAEACCGRPAFDRGFRLLVEELFPEPEWKLRRLPDDHPIYSAFYNWKGPRFLEGIDIHCRTAIVYLPQDLSCAWHQDRPQDLGAFKLGTNICAYATGMEPLKDKLDQVLVVKVEDVVQGPARSGALVVGKVRHNGGWNMDALAIPKLLSDMGRKANLNSVGRHHSLTLTDQNLYDYPLVYMSGAYTFTLSDEEKDRLRQYLKRGGVLFANALCGKKAFDTSFRALIKEVFPDQELELLAPDHPVYSCAYQIDKVGYTRAVREEHPGLDKPTLEGITLEGRTVVFYSKYDIGCGLDSGAVLHGKGYLRPCCFRLATNIVLYAMSF